jgi:2-ketoarginine methyltransferase
MATEAAFLGTTVQEWTQSIRNGYMRAYILFALHETGVFNLLKDGQSKSVDELAAECKIEPYLLNSVILYLLVCDKIIERDGEKIRLTEFGRHALFADTLTTFCWGAVGGYSIVLTELIPALRGKVKYGVDFERDGEYLATGSLLTGRGSHGWVLDYIKKSGTKRLCDMGCGSAVVLTAFCESAPELRGVGLDISDGFLTEAKRRIHSMHLDDRIELIKGDIAKPDSYIEKLGQVDAFNAMMVIHEFLAHGDQKIVEILKKMKAAFPGKVMIISEAIPYSEEEFRQLAWEDRPHPASSQYAFHGLTWQGIPQKPEVWFKIFEKAGVTLEDFQGGHQFKPGDTRMTQYASRMGHYVLRF